VEKCKTRGSKGEKGNGLWCAENIIALWYGCVTNAVMKDPLAEYESKVAADMQAIRRVRNLIETGQLPADVIEALVGKAAPKASASSQNGVDKTNGATSASKDGPRLGEVDAAVREAVKAMSGQFTATDITKKLFAAGHKYRRSSVRAVMRRMVPLDIEIAIQGQGRRPTAYTKTVF
jgi:hypothetical protein